jgi:hypothetical protein
MGIDFWPVYGNPDLGSAVENAEEVIATIKTNKFDNEDLAELKGELEKIISAIDTAIAKANEEEH